MTTPRGFAETVDSLRAVQGFGPVLPSIYRCLAPSPDYPTSAWRDLRPRLSPADLEQLEVGEEIVTDVAALFAGFNQGADGLVLPAIPLHAATVEASTRRDPM